MLGSIPFIALGADAGEECFGGLQLVEVGRAPVGGERAFEGRLQQGLTVGLQLRPGQHEALDRLVELQEELFDLRDDAVLFAGGGKREGVIRNKARWNTLLPDGPGHVVLGLVPKGQARDEAVNVLRSNPFLASEHVELGRAECDGGGKLRHDGHLAVLHARRDLGEEHVAGDEGRVALLHLTIGPQLGDVDLPGFGLDSGHWHEMHVGILRERAAAKRRVYVADFG